MSVISFQTETSKIFAKCADVFPLSAPPNRGDVYEFEVLAEDVDCLKSRLGQEGMYAIENQAYWGKILSLEACTSTHIGLSLMRERPTFHGVFLALNIPQGQSATAIRPN